MSRSSHNAKNSNSMTNAGTSLRSSPPTSEGTTPHRLPPTSEGTTPHRLPPTSEGTTPHRLPPTSEGTTSHRLPPTSEGTTSHRLPPIRVKSKEVMEAEAKRRAEAEAKAKAEAEAEEKKRMERAELTETYHREEETAWFLWWKAQHDPSYLEGCRDFWRDAYYYRLAICHKHFAGTPDEGHEKAMWFCQNQMMWVDVEMQRMERAELTETYHREEETAWFLWEKAQDDPVFLEGCREHWEKAYYLLLEICQKYYNGTPDAGHKEAMWFCQNQMMWVDVEMQIQENLRKKQVPRKKRTRGDDRESDAKRGKPTEE